MKFYKEEIGGNGKTRYCFAVGIDEMLLLHAMIKQTRQYIPPTIDTQIMRERLRNMDKAFGKALGGDPFNK